MSMKQSLHVLAYLHLNTLLIPQKETFTGRNPMFKIELKLVGIWNQIIDNFHLRNLYFITFFLTIERKHCKNISPFLATWCQ